MKQSFGARPARSCLLSMHWIVANHKRDGAVSVSVAGKTCPSADATTIELPDLPIYAIDAELDRLRCTYNPEVLCRDVGRLQHSKLPADADDSRRCRGTRQLPVLGSMPHAI